MGGFGLPGTASYWVAGHRLAGSDDSCYLLETLGNLEDILVYSQKRESHDLFLLSEDSLANILAEGLYGESAPDFSGLPSQLKDENWYRFSLSLPSLASDRCFTFMVTCEGRARLLVVDIDFTWCRTCAASADQIESVLERAFEQLSAWKAEYEQILKPEDVPEPVDAQRVYETTAIRAEDMCSWWGVNGHGQVYKYELQPNGRVRFVEVVQPNHIPESVREEFREILGGNDQEASPSC